jgi:CxxC motif-containing protein (DUF1111 family)
VAESRDRDGHSLEVRRVDALAAGRAGNECACERASISASTICYRYKHELAIARACYTSVCPAWLHACKRPSVDAIPAADATTAPTGAHDHASRPNARLPPADQQRFQRGWTKKRKPSISVQLSPSATSASSPDSTTVGRRLDQRTRNTSCHQARGRAPEFYGGLPPEHIGGRGSRLVTNVASQRNRTHREHQA